MLDSYSHEYEDMVVSRLISDITNGFKISVSEKKINIPQKLMSFRAAIVPYQRKCERPSFLNALQ